MTRLRLAAPTDVDLCLKLDASFETNRVWQLHVREGKDQAAVQMQVASLPRQVRADYPAPGDALRMHWQRGYCLIVAEEPATGQIIGYVDVGPEPDLQMAWLWHLVVDRSRRCQGIGSALLNAALAWSTHNDLARLVAPVQALNDAGIHFLQRRGFALCGYNDRFYRNGNVALFFARTTE